MNTTVEFDGRVAIPPEVQAALGIRPGVQLEIHCRQGRIELEPVASGVRLEQRGALTVAVPTDVFEPLTDEIVESVLSEVRKTEP